MSRREPPACAHGLRWVRDRLKRETGDKHPLAPLTGQDTAALLAFVHCVTLWGRSDPDGRRHAEAACKALVLAMQPSTRYLAKKAIPAVMDWSHEDQLWRVLFPIDPC